MPLVAKVVRPDNLQAWVKANAPGSLRGKGLDSWRAYLISQGATGSTLHDLENSFTPPAGTIYDAWSQKISATSGSNTKEKARNLYK